MAVRGPYETHPAVAEPRTLGERIRATRMAWGWTQGDLGAALNTDQTAVSTWERDRARPSGAALAALAGLFGVSTETLEGEAPYRVPAKPAESARTRALELPEPAGAVTLVDLREAAVEGQDVQEAILRLIQLGKEGRRVWMVVE